MEIQNFSECCTVVITAWCIALISHCHVCTLAYNCAVRAQLSVCFRYLDCQILAYSVPPDTYIQLDSQNTVHPGQAHKYYACLVSVDSVLCYPVRS